MSHLQISVALFCLLSLTCAGLKPEIVAQIKKEVMTLEVDKNDLSMRYWSNHEFTYKILDQGLKLVELMDAMVHEYGIEQEYPYVAEFVEDLKTFLEDTKIFTEQEMKKMADEYEEKESKNKNTAHEISGVNN
ncbi:hypothetical protein NQD34_013721 [Periophthalmus magnuspinnatus]|nr:hypothetical protein NQD34_013721 [Periophthalmus magnuspinnatus]